MAQTVGVVDEQVLPVFKPRLPEARRLLPHLERIDRNQWYTNHGPLTVAFERSLAVHFGVSADRIVTSANGTFALVQALRAAGAPAGSFCAMPSWTFVATPAAAIAAGLTPYFVDVDPQSWSLSTEDVAKVNAREKLGAVIVVSPFGAPIDLGEWRDFGNQTGTPVIIDAAAGFDTFAAQGVCQPGTGLTIMISLHATKAFGIGEGGLLIAADEETAILARMHGNFGFRASREAQISGFNAKLSEYAAAVGLAALAEWQPTRLEWALLSELYEREIDAFGDLQGVPGFNKGWVSSYGVVALPAGISSCKTASALAARGIETIAWWGPGCHRQKAYSAFPHTPLPHTEALAERVIGLPFWRGMTDHHVQRVFSALRDIVRRENS